jgi:DNA-binding transcriptional LysR family regulator
METFPQMKAIIDGSLDVGFTRMPDRYPAGLAGVIVDRQPFWMAIPEKHRLASRKRITPEMVLEENFVAVSLEMEVGFWGNLAALAPTGTALKIVDRAQDIFSVLTLVAAGAGLTSVSEPICRIGIPGIVYRKISGTTRQAEVCMVYRKNEDAPAVKAFIQMQRSKAGD